MRILVLIAIGLLLYVIIGNFLRNNKSSSNKKTITEKMVRCEHCGLHVIEQEAIAANNKYYCSEEHQKAERNKS